LFQRVPAFSGQLFAIPDQNSPFLSPPFLVLSRQRSELNGWSFLGARVVMQCQQIDVVPGDSLRIGNLRVTVLFVSGNEVALRIEGPENSSDALNTDPVVSIGRCVSLAAMA
jgi:hypothetical protein